MLFQSSLVFFVNPLVDISKLRVAIVFLQQAVVAFLQIHQSFNDFIKFLALLIKLSDTVNDEAMLLESLHEGITQSDIFRIVWVCIFCEFMNH